MTPAQLKLIHQAARHVGLNDGQYRVLLRTVAGVESAKDLDQRGLEDVMAHLEGQGWCQVRGGKRHPFYWRDIVANRAQEPSTRQVHEIQELAAAIGIEVDGPCLRHSRGRTDRPDRLTPWEASNVIEELKARKRRSDEATERRREEEASLFEPATCGTSRPPVLEPVAALSDDEIPF